MPDPRETREDWAVTNGVVQVVTTARFRRPKNPRRCNVHRYHVWRWETKAFDTRQQPADGMLCQCGALTWTHREGL